MHRVAALILLCAMPVAACAIQAAAPTPDLAAGVQYSFDFGGATIPTGRGEGSGGLASWTSNFACAYRPSDMRPDALRFDDSETAGWDLARDGGTPPPLTHGGAGVVLRVEPDSNGTFTVTFGLGGKTYTATAPADSATVGFHHVAYATPPELLAIERLKLTASDGTQLTLTGTASFPLECTGL